MEEKIYKTSEAARKASKKYREKNKEKETLNSSFRASKYFIKKTDDLEKLEELKTLILEKIKELNK